MARKLMSGTKNWGQSYFTNDLMNDIAITVPSRVKTMV